MSNITERVLASAKRNDRPVIIVYDGKKGITQRRIYIRKIEESRIIAYCMQKKALRSFDKDKILSAMEADE